ncbi:MAG: hypothetical protein V1754_07805 [Pseudomonadota bacterium]
MKCVQISKRLLGCAAVLAFLFAGRIAGAEHGVSVVQARMLTKGSAKTLQVRVPTTRAQQTRSLVQRLARLRLPGFVSAYQTTGNAKGPAFQGVTPVVAVDRGNTVGKWFNVVGKDSIGFATASELTGKFKPAYIRIGKRLYHFRAVRNQEILPEYGTPTTAVDIHDKKGLLTEATFKVSKKEMAAFAAYYEARYLGLIKDEQGRTIQPRYDKAGDTMNFRSEGCASACTSAFNPLWLAAFERNLPAIREYGNKNSNRALAGASVDMVETLRTFGEQRATGVVRGPKAMVRTLFPKADLITVFNGTAKDGTLVSSNPMTNLTWKGWSGLTVPTAMFDGAPSQTNKAVNATRMTLQDAINSL